MKTCLRCFGLCLTLLCFAPVAIATHNRAGEIVVEQIDGCNSNRVRVTVITYTKTSSVQADRDSLTVCFGDGSCEQVARFNGSGIPPSGEPKPNDIKYNLYIVEHTYSGPGRYTVSMTDPNRNGGIINVNPPASDNVQFHLQTTFTLFNPQFQGCNNTPVLLQPPIDYACKGEPFIHNPSAFDPDGDSLSYELITPMQAVDTPVPNYLYPNQVPNNAGSLTLNEVDGTLYWLYPQIVGEFNIAMIIISWRNGEPIDTTVRDMQILVFDCNNHAPTIETEDRICVIAGDVVEFKVTANDIDPGDKVKLSALGSPFIMAVSPADSVEIWRPEGNPSADYEAKPVVKTFRWQTACEHISDLDYTVVFKAEDDFFLQNVPGSTGLATLKAVRIKVVGPPPLDVQTQPASDHIDVSWEKPYKCEDSKDIDFVSFSVWRRDGSNPFPIDTCDPGLGGKGYMRIAYTKDVVSGRYQYTDTEVERGRTYCYRVLARFAKRSSAGQYYNFVEGLASDEVCVQLSRDVPLLTNVSVLKTDLASGQIEVKWTKPLADDLDTLLNTGPYRYELLRSNGITSSGFAPIASFTSPTYWQLNQNQYLDQAAGLNTQGSPYSYQLAFYVKGETEPLGFAAYASSIFLQIAPTDNANELSWQFDVPWVNVQYTVFRKTPLTAQWDSLTTVQAPFYKDGGLVNGREYCYYVKAYGSYGIDGVPSPLVNLSQEACAVPQDNVAPCPPNLTVRNICSDNEICQKGEDLNNRLAWNNPVNRCEETDDVVAYNVYFSPVEGGEFALVATIDDSGDTTFLHEPERGIAGCYAVTALDTFANESDFSPIICVDNCPNYSLPNAFTPNGDGDNELFIPYPFCFIEKVEMNIFNRWGELVFKTQDPNLNWNGENLKGKALAAGSYYYTCKVFEQRVTGTVESAGILSGYIDLIR